MQIVWGNINHGANCGPFDITKIDEDCYYLDISFIDMTLRFNSLEEAMDYAQAFMELPLSIRNIGNIIDKAEFNQDLREKNGLERKW